MCFLAIPLIVLYSNEPIMTVVFFRQMNKRVHKKLKQSIEFYSKGFVELCGKNHFDGIFVSKDFFSRQYGRLEIEFLLAL